MKDKIKTYLILAVVFIVYAAILYSFAYNRLRVGDYSTAAAYVCLGSIVASIICIKINPSAISRKAAVVIGVLTFIFLTITYIDSMGMLIDIEKNTKSINWGKAFSDDECLIALALIVLMGMINFSSYRMICKKEKEQKELEDLYEN